MSKALKCDRCGDFYIPYNSDTNPNQVVFYSFDYDSQTFANSKYFDLCPRCADRFESWLERPMRDEEKGVSR